MKAREGYNENLAHLVDRWKSLLLLFITIFLVSCSPDEKAILDISTVKRETFKIKRLTHRSDPYHRPYLAPKKARKPTDEQGIPLYVKDNRTFYHPIGIALKALHLIDSYKKTRDNRYLTKAELYACKVEEEADEYDDALFFPFKYNNRLGRRKPGGKHDYMIAPWYSGMAQGQCLSVFCRLFRLTHKIKYLKTANKIYKSFWYVERKDAPWVVYVDDNSYLWIEECPLPERTNILNGFIFGIYGIYDYYQTTKSGQSMYLFQAAVTTIKKYVRKYRHKGDRSEYCLSYKRKTSLKYHRVHIKQLRTLFRMTGDPFFKRMAEKFYDDAH